MSPSRYPFNGSVSWSNILARGIAIKRHIEKNGRVLGCCCNVYIPFSSTDRTPSSRLLLLMGSQLPKAGSLASSPFISRAQHHAWHRTCTINGTQTHGSINILLTVRQGSERCRGHPPLVSNRLLIYTQVFLFLKLFRGPLVPSLFSCCFFFLILQLLSIRK